MPNPYFIIHTEFDYDNVHRTNYRVLHGRFRKSDTALDKQLAYIHGLLPNATGISCEIVLTATTASQAQAFLADLLSD